MSGRPQRPPRRFLGEVFTMAERLRVYWTDHALEVDHLGYFEIRRRRVFFDEIRLVTLHKTRGGLTVLPVLLTLLWGLIALLSDEQPDTRWIALALTALFAVQTAVLLLGPTWVVTAFGERTRARIHFRLQEGKAWRVYADICRAAGEAQRALAERRTAEIPAPPGEEDQSPGGSSSSSMGASRSR